MEECKNEEELEGRCKSLDISSLQKDVKGGLEGQFKAMKLQRLKEKGMEGQEKKLHELACDSRSKDQEANEVLEDRFQELSMEERDRKMDDTVDLGGFEEPRKDGEDKVVKEGPEERFEDLEACGIEELGMEREKNIEDFGFEELRKDQQGKMIKNKKVHEDRFEDLEACGLEELGMEEREKKNGVEDLRGFGERRKVRRGKMTEEEHDHVEVLEACGPELTTEDNEEDDFEDLGGCEELRKDWQGKVIKRRREDCTEDLEACGFELTAEEPKRDEFQALEDILGEGEEEEEGIEDQLKAMIFGEEQEDMEEHLEASGIQTQEDRMRNKCYVIEGWSDYDNCVDSEGKESAAATSNWDSSPTEGDHLIWDAEDFLRLRVPGDFQEEPFDVDLGSPTGSSPSSDAVYTFF